MPPRLAISIINYRTADLTTACLESVLTDIGTQDIKVVVVDNASGDGSPETIEAFIAKKADARLSLVRSTHNSGFSGGHNQGIAAVPDADFYLVLNSDALLHPGFCQTILAAADANPEAGLVAPQLEWDDGVIQHSSFRFASPLAELIRGAETGPVTRIFKRHEIALPLPPDPDQIEWSSFACILLKGDMIRAIGPMDEGYFLYFEDSEYALRARRAGWKIIQEPAARAIHFRGGSGPVKTLQKNRKRLPGYYWRSRTRFLRQAHGPLGPILGNLMWIAGRMIAHLRLLTGRAVPPSNQGEWRDIWTGITAPLRPDPTGQAK